MTAVHLAPRTSTDQEGEARAHPRFEPLRDQIFAGFAYAFVITVPITGLLTAHLGRLALAAWIVLTVVLVPVNVCLMRFFARLRHAVAERLPSGRTRERRSSRRTGP
jgi:hypothetical protein